MTTRSDFGLAPERRGEVRAQREYYARTAGEYESLHLDKGEHEFALAYLLSMVDHLSIRSVLDVGAGTGRAYSILKAKRPDLHVVGVEPVRELREIGHRKGIPVESLVDGDACDLPYRAGEFDLVCEIGVLHHIPHPERAVAEMLRVASKAIFLSDENCFAWGSPAARRMKQIFHRLGVWPLWNLIRTRGRGYFFDANDGIHYYYSVFSNYEQIRRECEHVHLLNTRGNGMDLYRNSTHVALLGIKK